MTLLCKEFFRSPDDQSHLPCDHQQGYDDPHWVTVAGIWNGVSFIRVYCCRCEVTFSEEEDEVRKRVRLGECLFCPRCKVGPKQMET